MDMNTLKQTPNRVKNHVKSHKAAYVAGAVAVMAIALQQRNLNTFNEFLDEKGIDREEFYCPEAYQEKQNAQA